MEKASFPDDLTGEEIQRLQEELRGRGMYKGAVDGRFGPRTASAVEAYQAERPFQEGGPREVYEQLVSEKPEDRENKATPETVFLAKKEGTRVSIATTGDPWTLGVDALVVPIGSRAQLGGLGEALLSFLRSKGESEVEAFKHNVLAAAPPSLMPDEPKAITVPDILTALGIPTYIIFATAEGESGFSVADAGRAAQATIRVAAEVGVSRLALPVLGTGHGKLPPARAAKEILHGVLAMLPGGWIEEVILTTLDEDVVTALRGMSVARIPRFDAEGFEGEDRLGITPDVNAFASLMASRNLEPPLSIGLFGDWGSGKSFFMQKLKRRIGYLAELAKQHGDGGSRPAYLANIVQIEFNTWHYVESNLWASLVTHIFESLHRYFMPQSDTVRKQWEELLKKLDAAIDLSTDAERTLEEAKKNLTKAQKEETDREVALTDVVNTAWQELKKTEFKDQIEKVEKTLNFDEIRKLKTELLLRGSGAGALYDKLPIFRQTLVRGLGSLSTLGIVGSVVLVVVIALAVVVAWWPENEIVKQVSVRITEVVALIGGAATWLGTALAKATSMMNAVQRVEQAVAQKLSPQMSDRLQEAERDVALARDAVSERRKDIAEVQAQLYELQPSQRLSHFLADRAGSSDYRKHLGLPAMIRRDFERLYDLMHTQLKFFCAMS
jgi:peptidoglycan hydrolase-like protein with peptidoglycan-binding domain